MTFDTFKFSKLLNQTHYNDTPSSICNDLDRLKTFEVLEGKKKTYLESNRMQPSEPNKSARARTEASTHKHVTTSILLPSRCYLMHATDLYTDSK